MKRKLSPQEKELSLKSLLRLQEELEYNKYQFEICNLKIEKGLMQEYKKNMRDYKVLKKEYDEKIKLCNQQISILQEQIRNGVDIKKESKKEDK